MKRTDIKVGDTVAHVRKSDGYVQPALVLDDQPWVKTYSYGTEHEVAGPDGKTYVVQGYRPARDSESRTGVLVARGWAKWNGAPLADVVQLRDLQPLAAALAEHEANEAAIQARWNERRAVDSAWQARSERVLAALGIEQDDEPYRSHSRVSVSIEDLERIAALVASNTPPF